MNKRISLLLLCLFAACLSFAQPARVTARTDAAQIVIGDQVRLFIEATVDTTAARLGWARFSDTFNNLEIVERGKIDTTRQGNTITYKQRMLITGFDSGQFTIPSFAFYATTAAATDTLRTDSFKLTVQTVAVDTTQPYKNIKSIVSVKTSWTDNLQLIGGIALLIVIAVIATIYIIQNRKKKGATPVPEVVETDQEKALRLLDELVQKHLWENGQVKEYYTELTDVIRSYIEARFSTPAMELTTDEILSNVSKRRDMYPYLSALSSILHTADLAKFAKANPTPLEHAQAIDAARAFILDTKPTVEPSQNNTNKTS